MWEIFVPFFATLLEFQIAVEKKKKKEKDTPKNGKEKVNLLPRITGTWGRQL